MKPLYCGAAKMKITPPEELIPDLFGLMKSSFNGVHDDLFVRVIALSSGESKFLVISFDLDKAPCPTEFIQELEAQTGVPGENVLYFGIHAHAVPVLGFRPFEARNDIRNKESREQRATHAYEQYVLEKLLLAAKEALRSLRPAQYGYAYGKSYINTDRVRRYEKHGREGKGAFFIGEGWGNIKQCDPSLFFLRFNDMQGKPIAMFTNYAMHNVCMFLNDNGDGKSAISSDVGGTVSKMMENYFGVDVAIWSSGAAGDVNCVSYSGLAYPDPLTGDRKFLIQNKLESVAGVMEMLAATQLQDIIDINRKIERYEDGAEVFMATEYSKTPLSYDFAVNEGVNENYHIEENETYNIRLRLLKLGDVALIGADGELYSRLGTAIREASPVKDTIVINHEASLLLDNPGYVFDDETIDLIRNSGGCALPGWNHFYGVPGTIEASLVQCTRTLFNK